ncbi:MAG: ribosome small subunit-dependent GTPase A [Acidobacteriota bacterium]
MAIRRTDLIPLGWNEWLEERASCEPGDTLARVAAVDRDRLLLMVPSGTFRAQLAGRFLYQQAASRERPCVGDWVCAEKSPKDDVGLVRALLERKTVLRRRAAGGSGEPQEIAANVDTVVIVQSCHYDFNLHRLERYLVMVREGGAEPWVLLTKTDLVKPEVLASQVDEIRSAGIAVPVRTLSHVTGEGVEELKRALLPGRTYCFVGSSGVGKSTVLNALVGRERLPTAEVSATGEGRHTTVRRELVLLEGGALVIDNPGMREFGVVEAEGGIGDTFSGITGLSSRCRFRDCRHENEPGCAVREAVQEGALSPQEYGHFIQLREESEFYALSRAEKRQKDRDFGKFLKSAKKDLRRG